MSFCKMGFALLVNVVVTSVYSQQLNKWRDTSPHAIRFVTVEKNVRLEVLDWGGHGKPIVLLAGGGNTAHVFDDFAPRLSANFHVYGITRRGFGASQFSPIDNVDRLGKDILAVIDSLQIVRPILAGHSFAGAELSSVARISPGRIAALIYIDAGYPYAFRNRESPTMQNFFEINGPKQPAPGKKDLTNFKTLQNWEAETYGFKKPEAEFRHTWDSTSDGQPTHFRDAPGMAMFSTVLNDTTILDSIPVPSLVIFAIPHTQEAWVIKNTDPKIRSDAQNYLTKIDSLTIKQAKAFEEGVPTAQVIRLKGMHYIYISNEAQVISEIRKFISRIE